MARGRTMAELEIEDTEVSEEFIRGMRDRMVVSFHKYGPVADGTDRRVSPRARRLLPPHGPASGRRTRRPPPTFQYRDLP